MLLKTRRISHAHLRDSLQYHSLQAQIFPPAALKMRMMMVMWGRSTATRGVEGFGHKLYMDNFFPSPDLYDDLAQKKIFCCGTVRLHRKGMPKDLKPKTLRVKCGVIRVRTRGDLTAVVWKDKRDVRRRQLSR